MSHTSMGWGDWGVLASACAQLAFSLIKGVRAATFSSRDTSERLGAEEILLGCWLFWRTEESGQLPEQSVKDSWHALVTPSPLLPVFALWLLLALQNHGRSHPEVVDGRWLREGSVSPRLPPPGFLNERGKHISSRLLAAAPSA